MAWFYLLLAGAFEIGWPLGIKLAQKEQVFLGVILAALSITLSGLFLYLSQKTIPLGTAYAVWTGIGAAGTFIVGIIFFGDTISLLRILGISLIVLGVVTLKIA
ncbi:DMT family transporter [Rickettsiales bacterium LUAb2]